MATVPLLDDAVIESYVARPARPTATVMLMLDLTEMTFVDSNGITALDWIVRFVRGRDEMFSVVPPRSGAPRRLLSLAVRWHWLGAPFSPFYIVEPLPSPDQIRLPATADV